MPTLGARLKHAWNAFAQQYTDDYMYLQDYREYGPAYGFRPDRVRFRIPNERSIITSIYTRLGIDVASVDIRHARVDEEGRYVDDIDSGLNNCLTLQANIDQAATQFRQDIAMTLFDEGVAVIVPVDTTINPDESGGYDIVTLRYAVNQSEERNST